MSKGCNDAVGQNHHFILAYTHRYEGEPVIVCVQCGEIRPLKLASPNKKEGK